MSISYGQATYASDDTNSYNCRLNNYHYTASGLGAGVGGQPIYPHKWEMRKVHGVSSAGSHASLPVGVASGMWTGVTTTFTINSVEYTITGRTGEKRPNLAPDFS